MFNLLCAAAAAQAKTGIIDVSRGTGTANTSVVCHAGRVLALHEGDLPYQIQLLCSGLVETVRAPHGASLVVLLSICQLGQDIAA